MRIAPRFALRRLLARKGGSGCAAVLDSPKVRGAHSKGAFDVTIRSGGYRFIHFRRRRRHFVSVPCTPDAANQQEPEIADAATAQRAKRRYPFENVGPLYERDNRRSG